MVKTQQLEAAKTLDKRHHNGSTNVAQTLFDGLTKKVPTFNNVELQRLHDVHTTLLSDRMIILSLIISFLLINIMLYLIVEVNIPNFTKTKL